MNESIFPPIGPDGTPDLRFLLANRPAGTELAAKLRSLRYLGYLQEMWIAVSGSGKTSAIF